MKVLFIGGPGNLSVNTINLVHEKKENQISIFTLPGSPCSGLPEGVRVFSGNRDNFLELKSVIEEVKPDVVFDFVCFHPEQAQSIANLCQGKVAQFVFVSTCDVYGYPLSRLPMKESDPWVSTNSMYAENKRLCEEIFASYHDKGLLPLTIARPSYSFGNDFVISFFSRDGGKHLIARLKAGLPVFAPGDGTTLIHASSAYNTGRMIAQFLGCQKSIGKSYTCGHEYFITHDQYIGLFANTLGVEPIIVHIPYDILLATGAKDVKESILEDVTRHNIAFSMEKFKSDFPGFVWEKTLEQAASEYIAYNEKNGLSTTGIDPIFEDMVINAWKKSSSLFYKLI
jgi:hypothetical protein